MAGKTPEVNVEEMNHELQNQLLRAQLEEVLERKKAKQDQENQQAAVQKAAALAMGKQREDMLRNQANCNHIKGRTGETALIGNRDWHGNTMFACQRCGKEYDQTTVGHLVPPAERIGGPHLSIIE